jgi:hypothetical protein
MTRSIAGKDLFLGLLTVRAPSVATAGQGRGCAGQGGRSDHRRAGGGNAPVPVATKGQNRRLIWGIPVHYVRRERDGTFAFTPLIRSALEPVIAKVGQKSTATMGTKRRVRPSIEEMTV